MLRRVLFLSQARAEAMRPPRGAALISITDADAPQAWLPDGWVALHRVAFDDIDPEDTELDDFFEDDDYEYVPMSMAHATAIAKAVCTARGLHFPPPYELPNPFVYRLMCRALGTVGPD